MSKISSFTFTFCRAGTSTKRTRIVTKAINGILHSTNQPQYLALPSADIL